MRETNSPSVAHVSSDISPLSKVKLQILNLTLLSGEISQPTGNWRRIYIDIYIKKTKAVEYKRLTKIINFYQNFVYSTIFPQKIYF